jgi:O-antigen/teichoic acid export membrane protein
MARDASAVRRRTAATLAGLGAPAAVGLALVAGPVAVLLLGPGRGALDYAATADPLRIMSAAVPAMCLNALLAASLNACGRAGWLPRLVLARVVLALVLALALVPHWGGTGAALGLVASEWLLLALGAAASRRAGFAVPVASSLAASAAACVPMALAVSGLRANLAAAIAVGALTWAATLAASWRLAPSVVRRVIGDVRYP